MDWQECNKMRLSKQVSVDHNLMNSLRSKAERCTRASEILPWDLADNKVTMMYDALRELLECLALKNGYKIYNHECYGAFLKEVILMSREADEFDKIRKIRNGINYYDRTLDVNEAKQILSQITALIEKIKKIL